MNRREFLNRLKKPAIVLAAVPAMAVAAADRGRQAIDPHLQALKSKLESRFESVEQRIDNMERSQKRMMKAMFILGGVTLGIDLSHLI